MIWTTATPTKPGWYWHRDTRGDEQDRREEVVELRPCFGRLTLRNVYIDDGWPGGEWAGPLRKPRRGL